MRITFSLNHYVSATNKTSVLWMVQNVDDSDEYMSDRGNAVKPCSKVVTRVSKVRPAFIGRGHGRHFGHPCLNP